MHILRWIACVMGLVSAGCIGSRADLVRSGAVALSTYSPASVRLAGVGVYEGRHDAVVQGSVERLLCTSGIVRGHVDVEVLGPGGEIVSARSARLSPGDVPTHYPKLSHFAARVDAPPPGSTVRVSYHPGLESHHAQ